MNTTIDHLINRFWLNLEEIKPENIYYVPETFSFYQRRGGVLQLVERTDFERLIYRFLVAEKEREDDPLPAKFNPKPTIIRELVELIPASLPDDRIIKLDNVTHVALSDGKMLNCETFEIEPLENQIAFLSLPINTNDIETFLHDPVRLENKMPHFSRYLQSTLVDPDSKSDLGLISLVQEMIGYLLVPHNPAHKAFFLYGLGSNGKSVLLSILENIFPKELTSAKSLERLTNSRFATSSLVGKIINIAGEDDSRFISTDIFKQIVAGDTIDAEYKMGKSFSFKPQLKCVFATNAYLSFESFGYAVKRRIVLIPFLRRFEEHERDIKLVHKIVDNELKYVILFGLQGAKRLSECNYQFSQSILSDDLLAEMEKDMSSSVQFIIENFTLHEDEQDTKFKTSTIYRKYVYWCELTGRKPRGRNKFYQEIDAANIKLRKSRVRVNPTDNPSLAFTNISVNKESDYYGELFQPKELLEK